MTCSPYVDRPPETMWQAALRLMTEAERTRDLALWDRAFRLWQLAAFSYARGIPFTMTSWRAPWLS